MSQRKSLKTRRLKVPNRNDSRDPDVAAINSELSEGLEACRAIVGDYRAALSKTTNAEGRTGAVLAVTPAAKDEDSGEA